MSNFPSNHSFDYDVAVLPHHHPTLAEICTYPAEELAERITPRE